jgi:hypothetical protein
VPFFIEIKPCFVWQAVSIGIDNYSAALTTFWGIDMRVLVTFAFVIASALAVTACFHHQQQVVAEPIAAPPYK